jgi:DNA-binding response OmpR family regulator
MPTGRDTVEDKLRAFEAGVDDFWPNHSPEELIARVRALLRRRSIAGQNGPLRFADLALDPCNAARRGAARARLGRLGVKRNY